MRDPKKVLIIHHNDDDGFCSAYIATYYLCSMGCNRDDITLVKASYLKTLMEYIREAPNYDEYGIILILDYSVSNDLDAGYLAGLNSRKDLVVVWIDHHKSTFDMIAKYPELNTISGIRYDGIAACNLSYIYFKNTTNYSYNRDSIISYLDEAKYERSALAFHKDFEDRYKIPIIIRTIGRYDVWVMDDVVKDFHIGFDISEDIIHQCIESASFDRTTFMKAQSDGKIINKYNERTWKKHLDMYGFKMNVEVQDGKIVRALCLNTPYRTSLVFGDRINDEDIDVCIPYTYDGNTNKWCYSVYTTKDDVDCSEIAKFFGGGGHKKAAGFSLKDNILEY